ncbi:putative leucine-rich repeat receptor-like serine/threonine-protein kinase At2g24130 isoform X1 [Cryptomeria japonica]|uniref:putative leucine-rich repeat receptor-like serine/threonine-protein kinase At2g24130 isoform X1 n=1 Tax=Cryptomeria japonica TaxID=3369 RepID=UPI0027D9F2C1|nr:putative leucine-rich repeat receptor-like serine/threonine-protein kinase At2g24130 isoform X1 [Cryptomeria japonica]
MISGEIPKSLGDLPQLRDLVLHHNQLSGKLPASLGRCITLEKVDLAHNKLEGNIPLEWAALENLQFYFDISNNLLQGSISVMSKMVMVQAIDVSVNNFSGNIPDVLSSCTNLQYLNLSWNSFDGLIPTSLTSLKNLQAIDLSSNNLSGTIPMAFQEMKMLQYINLSSNNLIGEVPKRGVFARIDKSAVSENIGLCGDWIKLQPCFDSKHKQFLFSKKVIILVVISIAIFIMSSAVFLFFYRRNTNQNIPNLNFGPERISYEELVDATSGFSQTNLLGVGSFGSVYRGILKNGTNIAVKVINLQDENALQSFERECNVLKRVRHRNVIKIISTCSNLDFRALVLPFMSNGSLERWLYPHGRDECRLNLADRLRIAKEIAQGMEYLHHYCFVQVIHCDLKPNNVLLGNDMTPHIADFGITKLLFENSMNSLTSTTALNGSIGYFAPEYGLGGSVSTKGDVYSYGILLLELLTRRRPTDTMFV